MLYSPCIPVKGNMRSTICDLSRSEFIYIPNILFDILTKFRSKPISEIIDYYNKDNYLSIKEYFSFLEEKDLGFWTNEPERFPKIDLTWKHPSEITNAVIEIDRDSDYDIKSTLNQLNELRCEAIQLIVHDLDKNKIIDILDLFDNTCVRTINLIIHYNSTLDFNEICNQYKRIDSVFQFNSGFDKIEELNEFTHIIYSSKEFKDLYYPSSVGTNNFSINISSFAESQLHNLFYNRKIVVDKNGNFKRSYHEKSIFSNVNKSSIIEIINLDEFQELWSIKKDDIKVCKECEHRYICPDNRIPIRKNGAYEHITHCNYNPIIAKWIA